MYQMLPVLLLAVVAALMSVAGCAPTCVNPDKEIVPAVSVETVKAAWVESFGPLPPACDEHLPFVALSEADMTAEFGAGVQGAFTPGCPTVFIRAHLTADKGLVVHEVSHFLMQCTGRDEFGDHDHKATEVWVDFVIRTTVALETP